MKFLFIINRWANFYFFVQNLSEWHSINRKHYNQIWKKELGPFSTKEKNALKKLKKIHLKYTFNGKYLGRPFFLNKSPLNRLEKHTSKREITNLKNIFAIFLPKFKILYKKDLPLIRRWQEKLQKKANNKSLINSITTILATLYNTLLLRKQVKVYLLFSSPLNFGGGASIGNKAITLETSRYPFKKTRLVIGAIWHEVIHTCFEKKYFLPLLQKNFPKNQEAIDLIEEATARAVIFPGGILGKKFLKIHLSMNGVSKKHIRSLFKLRKLVKKYIQKNKPFDKEYIEKAFSILFDLKGILH